MLIQTMQYAFCSKVTAVPMHTFVKVGGYQNLCNLHLHYLQSTSITPVMQKSKLCRTLYIQKQQKLDIQQSSTLSRVSIGLGTGHGIRAA
jgi:hypothetical protein